MKHQLVKQLRAENKKLKAEMRMMVEKKEDNDCLVCSGISDGSLRQLEKKIMSKCH